nr:proton pump-interactor 1-like isoform X1 [Coffea arabica]
MNCLLVFWIMEILNLEEKVKNAEALIHQKNEARLEIVQRLQKREFDRFHIRTQLENLSLYHGYYKVDAIRYLQGALDEYDHVDEFTKQIKGSFHRLKCGRNSLAEEKQILREIKCAQEQKEKSCANLEAKSWSHWQLGDVLLNSKESIKSQFDQLYNELEGESKQQKAYYSKIKGLQKRLPPVEREISSLEKKLEEIDCERKELYGHLEQLRSCVDTRHLFWIVN